MAGDERSERSMTGLLRVAVVELYIKRYRYSGPQDKPRFLYR